MSANKNVFIEVLNSNGDIKLTKMRNPRAIFRDTDLPDEYVFKDVDYINIFGLIQENQQLKEQIQDLRADYGNLAQVERGFYKSVLKEIREYIKEHENESIYLDCKLYETKVYNDLLEIIGKGIGG